MDASFEKNIIRILNDWYDNLTIQESDYSTYTFTKGKFREKYLIKTGEFLKITKRTETVLFNRICSGLENNYEVTEELIDQYLDWCFDNYEFFVKKYKAFNLNSCASYASEWNKQFLSFDFNNKLTIEDLKDVEVKQSIFSSFEKYGVPLAATKLQSETKIQKAELKKTIIEKLSTLTKNKEGTNRLKNILRVTVENAPYAPSVLFSDYATSLKELFAYFKNEPWCPK